MKTTVKMKLGEKGTLVCPACGLKISGRDKSGELKIDLTCPNGCKQEIIYYPKEGK